MESITGAKSYAEFFGAMVMTDPIVGNWTKTVMFAGTIYCRFHADNTGIAKGKVFGHSVNEPFT